VAPVAPGPAYEEAVAVLGTATLAALQGLEIAERHLHPPRFAELRGDLALPRERLEAALGAFSAQPPADPVLRAFHDRLEQGARQACEALALLLGAGPPELGVARLLASLSARRRAQAALYALRRVLAPIDQYFLEPAARGRPRPPDREDAGTSVGVHEARGNDRDRGGFALYVPEWWDGATPWPLVVALHGGMGHGRDFLWTWLREARTRGFLLLAPTSVESTWSLMAPEVDAARLVAMIDHVAARWPVDRARVLLTGLSDGATFTLEAGLLEGAPYTALAPVSGVLHPLCLGAGCLERARGRRIYQAHGALDWLFPIELARFARDELARAGADLTYREIEDLSHTYPREENAAILAWFDPALALRG